MVVILRLGTSDDQNLDIPDSDRTVPVCQATFENFTGERAETIVRRIVPTPNAADVVGAWMKRYEPDCVVMVISSVWCSYETTANQMAAAWPALLQPIARRAERFGRRTASHNGLGLRVARRVARRTIGVSPRFTPEAIVESTTACLRRILQDEDVALVVRGPVTRYPGDGSAATRARLESRRRATDHGLAVACARLHVDYLGRPADAPERDDDIFLTDGVHVIASEHRSRGEREGRQLAVAFQRLHAASASAPVTMSIT